MTDYSPKNCTTLFDLIGDDLNEELFSGEMSNGFFIKGFSQIVNFFSFLFLTRAPELC